MIVVLTGVSGSGKTTIGKLLAERMGAVFADADDYHSRTNKEKMRSGQPLTDQDRQPWLEALNGVLRDWQRSNVSGVLACSALKARYREMLGAGLSKDMLRFVLLDGTEELLADRLAHRHHEFMNPKLLTSQLKTLERPKDALIVMNDRTPDEVVADILRQVRGTASAK